MGSRNYVKYAYGHEKYPVKVRATIKIGATGAPTLQQWVPASGGGGAYAAAPSGGTGGVKSITRNGTGDYTLTLMDAFQRHMEFVVYFQAATTLKAAAPIVSLQTTTTNVNTSTGGTIRFFTQSAQNTAADPASGEIMFVSAELSNSTTYG